MFVRANWIALVMFFLFFLTTQHSLSKAIVSVRTLVECISLQCTCVRTSKMEGYLNVYFCLCYLLSDSSKV